MNTSIPLVFCFHGYNSNVNTIMNYTNFNYISDTWQDLLLSIHKEHYYKDQLIGM